MLKLIFVVQLLYYISDISASSLGMEVVYEWGPGEIDFTFPLQELRNASIANGTLVPNNFLIIGLAVHKHRMFITIIWELTYYFTVAYVNLKEISTMSPKFMPYPSWDAYLPDERGKRRIGHVFRACVDRCDRLWLLEIVSADKHSLSIIVMDLNSDTIIRTYTFPAALHSKLSEWIVVEERDCENTFAYVTDHSLGGFWTYSWAENDSWHIDGHKDIYAPILAPNCDDSFSTLYYQNFMNSSKHIFHESYFVSTKHLRDKTTALSTVRLSNETLEHVNLLEAIFDPTTNILYSSDDNDKLRLILCWNKKHKCPVNGISELTIEYVDSYNTVFFYEIMAVDGQGNLWIVARRGTKTALLKFSPPIDIFTGAQ